MILRAGLSAGNRFPMLYAEKNRDLFCQNEPRTNVRTPKNIFPDRVHFAGLQKRFFRGAYRFPRSKTDISGSRTSERAREQSFPDLVNLAGHWKRFFKSAASSSDCILIGFGAGISGIGTDRCAAKSGGYSVNRPGCFA